MLRIALKIVVWVAGVLLCIVVTLVIAEAILRLGVQRETSEQRYAIEYMRLAEKNIPAFWNPISKTDNQFVPPFIVFNDNLEQNGRRLMYIASTSQLRPSRTWVSYDFLQQHSRMASTTYTIHSNSLGFRGPERTIFKPKNTIRIIVLGTYSAFGYGVEERDTYEQQLEKLLNEQYPDKKFEVWNGGKVAGTAIIGLARMEYEIFKYKPDIIILDYGPVDISNINLSYLAKVMHLSPSGAMLTAIRLNQRRAMPYLQKSLLWQKIWGGYYGGLMRTSNTNDFIGVMRLMQGMANEHQVPLILLKQPWTPQVSVYREIATGTTRVVDIQSAFETHPLHLPSASQWKADEWGKTWLAELDPRYLSDTNSQLSYAAYKLDVFQLNARGYGVVAQELLKTIKEIENLN